jgi:hypothetical protein
MPIAVMKVCPPCIPRRIVGNVQIYLDTRFIGLRIHCFMELFQAFQIYLKQEGRFLAQGLRAVFLLHFCLITVVLLLLYVKY